jgi:hypothetical protein
VIDFDEAQALWAGQQQLAARAGLRQQGSEASGL